MVKAKYGFIIKIVLPIIFIQYVCSTSFFQHKHCVEGKLLVHSHPYKKGDGDDAGHTHSPRELCSICHLAKINSTDYIGSDYCIEKPDIAGDTFTTLPIEDPCYSVFLYTFQLRAPPSHLINGTI